MLKAGFIVARVFFFVLAASVLGVAMLAVPTAARAAIGGCTKSNPCSLAFTADGQPHDTVVNTTITSAFNSKSGPIKVEILDASMHLNTNAKAAITIAITPTANPGNGTLSGTTTVTTSGGVASFSGLSINQTGFGYTLTATSPGTGISSATSADFNIWKPFQNCSSTCSTSASGATSTGTVTASQAKSTDLLGIGIGVSYQCNGTYKPLSDAFGFDVLDSSTGAAQPDAQFTVIFRIEKSLVLSSGHTGASSWQICYASQASFAAQPGTSGTATIGGITFNTGLLPVCSPTQGSPCVQARTKDNAGDVIITFSAVGDPFGHP